MRYTDIQNTPAKKHNDWLKSLDFYREDLGILTGRLNEVAGKNSSNEARVGIEHFENQFEIQRHNINDLQHRIKANVHSCATDVREHAGKVNIVAAQGIEELETSVALFEETIKKLRKEFNLFLSKWM